MNKLIVTSLGFLLALSLHAQTKIKGVVTDTKGESIAGANIIIKGTYDGASSAADGTFAFSSEEKGAQTISVSFVGYKSSEQQVELKGGEIILTINLEEEIN